MTKIGLDYGGVISFAPEGWMKAILSAKKKGHEFFLVSHAQAEEGLRIRKDYAEHLDIVDLSFGEFDSASQEKEITNRKAELCNQYGIEIFIDDDLHRAMGVGKLCKRCAAFYIPQNLWQLGERLIEGLGEDY